MTKLLGLFAASALRTPNRPIPPCPILNRSLQITAKRTPLQAMRCLHTDTLKPSKMEKEHVYATLFVLAIGGAIAAFDVYYYLYEREPNIETLSPEEFRNFKLKQVIEVNHDTSLFRFIAGLDPNNAEKKQKRTSNDSISAPTHVIVKDDSCQIARAYTPITYGQGHFDLLVKKYPDGSLSNMIHGLKVGEYLSARGPLKTFDYIPNMTENLGMIAGGTGITPMYQLIKSILSNPEDKTCISLLFGSKTKEDILLKKELDILSQAYPNRLRVKHVVQSGEWEGDKGIITEKIIKEWIPGPKSSSFVMVCGTNGMIEYIAGAKPTEYTQGKLGGLLANLGYTSRQVIKL